MFGSMGGEYGPLGRRHSGKGRAVPVRCPSIVPRLVAFSLALQTACTCIERGEGAYRNLQFIQRLLRSGSSSDFTETIHLNQSLGTPSARVIRKLFAAIDAEPERYSSPCRKLKGAPTSFQGAPGGGVLSLARSSVPDCRA
jgi:hypothetical protein